MFILRNINTVSKTSYEEGNFQFKMTNHKKMQMINLYDKTFVIWKSFTICEIWR